MEYYQFKQNNRTYTIDFCNDVVFKKIISDQESLPFLQFLVEAATGLKFQEFTLIPTVQPGNHVIDKQIRLDIHAKDESGQKILIEMQNTVMNATESKRFQYYNFIDIVNQLIRGQNYNDLQEVFTIVFIRDDSFLMSSLNPMLFEIRMGLY